jgi:hypothetical protein
MLGPGLEAAVRRLDLAEHLLVLLVVDEQVGPLPPRDLADLGAGERRVQQHDPGAALGGSEHRVEEATMVADQDCDSVPGLEPAVAPRVRDRVGAFVQLLVGELTELVDQHDAIPMADRSHRDRPAQQPEAFECEQRLRHAMRQLGSDHAASDTDGGEVGLVA